MSAQTFTRVCVGGGVCRGVWGMQYRKVVLDVGIDENMRETRGRKH